MGEHLSKGGAVSRRGLLKFAAALAVGWVVERHLTGEGHASQKGNNGPVTSHEHHTNSAPNTFEDAGAQSVAQELGLQPGGYYQITSETVDKMTGGHFLDNRLSPIFPPSIQQQAELIRTASKKYNLPANFLATIMTIESLGRQKVASSADAYGLMQIVPEYHFDDFAPNLPPEASYKDYKNAKSGKTSAVPLTTYQRTFDNPKLNIDSGAKFLASCLQTASANSGLQAENPVNYTWAGAYYNAGQGHAGERITSLPTQAQLYTNHIIRLLIDVEVASRLQARGYSDNKVLKAMFSDEMNARAYAYYMYGQKLMGSGSTIDAYNQRADYLTAANPGHQSDGKPMLPYGQLMHRWYQDYFSGQADIAAPGHKYDIPATPGLRIWMAGGGEQAFAAVPEDANWRL